ncbi:MAG TPA: GSCFA domain-containing protein [Jatrophihabitans sp.]|uniref:GSCFA domain-containing protein n=1 Tax=Jatrophihabitans sp. TaxID=1932789 RepID=UPI002F1C3086
MNPYQSLPARSFWRTAVAEPEMLAIDDLWTPKFDLGQDDPILTAGSCFARHIGRTLLELGMNWRDAEPAPPGLTAAERAARQYGVFSFRTGNIYTAAMLRQWLGWATGAEVPGEESWVEDGRHFDPFRPSVEPAGYDSAEAMLAARRTTLAAIRAAVADASCLVFTLGLTEAWHDRRDGVVYPVCPGTVRGVFDPDRHEFRNHAFAQVQQDVLAAVDLARSVNPGLRVLLTVSPVGLTATATGEHALTANTYSKSVLRAVAGQLAQEHEQIDYFPAYEIITGVPFRGAFYEPNLRDVTPEGVEFVMRRFTAALSRQSASQTASQSASQPAGHQAGPDRADSGKEADLLCDDAVLDYYNAR